MFTSRLITRSALPIFQTTTKSRTYQTSPYSSNPSSGNPKNIFGSDSPSNSILGLGALGVGMLILYQYDFFSGAGVNSDKIKKKTEIREGGAAGTGAGGARGGSV